MESVPITWRNGGALLAGGDAMKTLLIVLATMAATVVLQRLSLLAVICWEAYGHDVVSLLRRAGDRVGRLRVRG